MKKVNKKVILGMMLTVLISSMFGIAFKASIVGAGGTIYIRPDGSVYPPTAPIQRIGDVYTFTGNIYDSIVVERNNLILDGNGHLLQGPNYLGIDLSYRKNVTIISTVISSFSCGIRMDSSYYNKIINNTVLCSELCGIKLSESYENILVNNTVMNSHEAISLEDSNCNTLSSNKVIDNLRGISLSLGTNNTLRNNIMTANKYNFFVGFLFLRCYIHDIDTSNIVDGKPIYYWINRYNKTVPLDAGCVIIVNSSRISVKNLKLENNTCGVTLAFTRNSLVENVTATANEVGINLDHSYSNLISKNNINASNGAGIGLLRSLANNLTYNVVLNTNGSGIWLEDTQKNTLIGNNIAYTHYGEGFQEFDGAGILVDDSRDCKVIGNNVTNNIFGIVVGAGVASSNLIIRNNITMNNVGLILFETKDNVIYHNNFMENKLQHVSTYVKTRNTFDSGYPSGGNYWSDYAGVDLYSGSYQNETGSDGIGDTPYIIDENNQDNYPLMNLWILHDIAITNITLSKNVVGQKYTVNIKVTIENQGDTMETFNVTTYANTTVIDTKEISLTSGDSTTITFTWNTTLVPLGNYTISADATEVPGETDLTDNTFIDGWVIVTIPGDINGDGEVDWKDLKILAMAYGSEEGEPEYVPEADFNGDGKINWKDLKILALNYGKTT